MSEKLDERLEDVSTGVLDELERLGGERSVLLGRIEKLEGEYRRTITEVVYQRVHRDYETRLQALDDKARPLHEKARGSWAKLQGLRSEVQAETETIALDVEELKIRQALGEFTEDEVKTRLEEMESEKKKRERIVADAEKLHARFERVIEASGGAAEKLRPRDQPEENAQDKFAETDEEEAAPEEPAEEAEAAQDNETAAVREQEVATGPPPPGPPRPADFADALTSEIPRVEVPIPDDWKTQIARPARLVLEEALKGIAEFRVHPLTTIGRTAQNQIKLDHPSVSRRHAKITVGAEGYILEDLGSENGVFVNGERIARKVLENDDRVLVGTVSMRFVEPQ